MPIPGHGFLGFIQLIFNSLRRRRNLLGALIIEYGNVAIGKLPDVMLIGKDLAVDKRKHIGFAAQTPHHLAGLKIDLGDLIEIPARQQ